MVNLIQKPSRRNQQSNPMVKQDSLIRRFARSMSMTGKSRPAGRLFDTLGGVYVTETCCGASKSISFRSLVTRESDLTQEESLLDNSDGSWTSSDSPDHHQGAPLVVRKSLSRRHINVDPTLPDVELGDEEILGRIMLKSRKLPKGSGVYASNHVMINNERTKKYTPPLRRMPGMDELAREHARAMAEDQELFHTAPAVLQDALGKQCGRRIGENVTRGANLHKIHKAMMESVADRNNILDRRFTCMGVGTAKASDGTLYLCQLFRD
jgi:hypothetical protein